MNKLCAAFIALVLTAACAWAQPVCTGNDLLAKMKQDDPTSYGQIMAEAAATPNGEAMFWRIEKKGVAASHLLGTAHVTDPRITTLPQATEKALAKATSLVLELAELADPGAMAKASFSLGRLMVMPPGKVLWDVVPDADEAVIRAHPNIASGGGTIYAYQPWVVAMMFALPACETARVASGLSNLDTMLARKATARGMKVVGLETMEEQLSLFAGMPMEEQVKFLVATAKLGDQVPDYFETMISAYESRQITTYMPLTRKLYSDRPNDLASLAMVERDIIIKRNILMAERAQDILAKGGAFIAVGALHLPGKEGLVELIRKAGYKVSPVN